MAMIARIHVNQHALRRNRKAPLAEPEPVVTVKRGGRNVYGFVVECPDGATTVYRPHRPLSCGAVLWVETMGRVIVDGVEL